MKVSSIQFLAMLTMLIDHIGLIWFPQDPVWRIIGRLAMPFYAYAIVLGYFRTSDMQRYLKRLAFIALLSQLPYQLAFHQLEVNTAGSLFMCLLLLVLLDKWKEKRVTPYLAAAGFMLLLETLPFSYGAYIVILVLIYRYAAAQWMTLFHFSLNVVSFMVKGWFIQLFSLFATMLFVYTPDFMSSAGKIRIPRIIWRSFYPLHLFILAVIRWAISS
ncbi:conjugal transfer protein TraX [Paenibacillus alkaliterrae]|uniref:TraX family protein n=1 Tax=Paenibacillus alkaliterrae TaxID=320909 RepID=UPI001F1815A3|nr:TraX family protein [Paenibacillus alkaliterrae]MCF2938869.1 conjugal transfer protein TraX [Paenibacillus alkaliterrae]